MVGIVSHYLYKEIKLYQNSYATIVCQKEFKETDSYTTIKSVDNYVEPGYKGRKKLVTQISLSDNDNYSYSQDIGAFDNLEDFGVISSSRISNGLMDEMYPNLNDSRYNSRITDFKPGTKIQTSHFSKHYDIVYYSSLDNHRHRASVSKPVKYKKTKLGNLKKFIVDNHVYKSYY